MESFNKTLDRYRAVLAEHRLNNLRLPNNNFDTGKPTREGEYRLADAAYAALLEKLADVKTAPPSELRANILAFYGSSPLQLSDKARQELDLLRQGN